MRSVEKEAAMVRMIAQKANTEYADAELKLNLN